MPAFRTVVFLYKDLKDGVQCINLESLCKNAQIILSRQTSKYYDINLGKKFFSWLLRFSSEFEIHVTYT